MNVAIPYTGRSLDLSRVIKVAASAWVLPLLLAGGLILRLWRINEALWYDEAFSAWLASLGLPGLLQATLNDVHPPLYYLLLSGWVHLFGSSELSLRMPSVLAGLGLVIVTYQVGHSLRLSRRATLLATGLCAFSPFQVYYSQEARAYALLSLAVAVTALGLLRAGGQGGKGAGTMAVGGSLVALYLNNLAVFFIGPLWLVAMLQPRRFLTPALVVAGGYLPGLAWTVYQALHIKNGYWIPPLDSPGRILAVLDDLIFFTPNNTFVLASGLITALALVLVVSSQWSVVSGQSSVVGSQSFLLVATFAPLSLVTLASLVWQPVLISRVMAPIAPFFYLLIAQTVTQTRRRAALWLGLAAPVLASVLIGPLFHPAMGRRVTDTDLLDLYGLYEPGDGLYHASVGSYIVWHYYRPDIPQYLFPQQTTLEQNLTPATLEAMGAKQAYLEEVYCSIAKRWWLIYFNNPTTAPVEYEYIDYLLNTYPSRKIALLRYDVTVEAWLVLIEPDC